MRRTFVRRTYAIAQQSLNLGFTQAPYTGDKIAPMRKLNWLYGLAALAILVLLAGAAYRLPPVHDRLSWRVDFAMTYIRGLIHPIQAMPTALPKPQVQVASLP